MNKYLLLISFFLLSACSNETSNSSGQQVTNKQSPQVTQQKFSKPKAADNPIEYSDLTEFKILSIVEGLYENTPALQINLTLPIDNKQDVSELVKVTSKDERVKGEWIYNDSLSTLYFPFIEAETHYKIFVNKDLLAINGKKVTTGAVKNINTKPYQKSVRFVSKGSTLLKDSNVLPIEAVNVDAVDMKFWRIHADKYTAFLNMSYRNEIYSLEKMYKMADVVYTSQFSLDSIKNKREKHNVSIKNIEQVQKAGLYFVTISPKDMYSYKIESTWFMTTDIGLHTRMYKNSIVAFTHKIPQAEIYPSIDISLLDNVGNELASGVTDSDGFAEIQYSDLNKAVLLVAKKGDNFNLIRLKQAKMDLSEFNLVDRKHNSQELFLYAPRDLYRPGEIVNINGLLRDYDGKLVQASPIKVKVKRPDNRVVKTFNWQGDASSLYESEFSIANDAMTGMWVFEAELANKDSFEYKFAVEDFLPERLKLELSSGGQAETNHISATDLPVINVQSDYLYGAPAANNRFDATVTVNSETQLFDYKDYVFGSKKYRDYRLNFDTKPQNLDANGAGVIKLKNDWQETKFPLRITSFVNVYESGGRPISRTNVQTVWPHDVAVGLRPLWDSEYASPQSNNEIELIAINQQGEKIDIQNLDIMLIREDDRRYWQWGDDGWSYSNSEKNTPVFNTVINLSKDTKSVVNLPLDYGNYRVEVRDQGQQLLSSYQFFSGWNWYDNANASGERPDQVKLAWQADNISNDSQAELKITAPYAGIALITIESDKVLYKQSISMSSAEQTITIPVGADWNSHNIYASVMVIREGEVSNNSKRQHLPARSFGIIHLPLNRDNRQLDIAIENPEKILPETKATIKIKATNLDASKETFVTIAAVDTGVLNISNFKTPNPFEWFFAKRKYLGAIRDMYGSIIALGDGKNAKQKFGGDGDINRGGDAPANAVQIVSLFAKKVKFDNGIATVELDIPYFNGELRLMAMAYNDNQFAGVESRMIVAAPIVVSASMPRFIAKGDNSFATIDVHNTEDFDQTISLQLTADKALGEYTTTNDLQLKAKEKKIIKLPITASIHSGIGSVNVKATISGKTSYKLDRKWDLGIRPAFPAITETTSAVIEQGKSFSPSQSNLTKFDDASLKSVLKISKIPVLNADEHLRELIQYPYGCLEQTSSRVWPLLEVEEADFALFGTDKQHEVFAKRSELIDGAISRILGMQRYDGSFGLWNNNSHEEKWLTAYATDLLLNAKKRGYNVPEAALNKAIKRLGKYIQGNMRYNSDLARYLESEQHFTLAYQAYAAYVLAGIKKVNLQDVRRLFDNNNSHAKRPLPLAHLAMALEMLGDDRRANQAWLKSLDFDTAKNNSYYADYGSSVRDLSQIIFLSNQSHLTKALLKSVYSLITPLQEAIKSRRWFSTQERVSLFRLAKSLKKNQSPDDKWTAVLDRNSKQDDFAQADDLLKVWYQKSAKTNFSLTNTYENPLYIDFKTQGYLTNSPAQSNGIKVERRYFDIKGNNLDISKLTTGDMVLVHLRVRLDKQYNYLPDAMLVELLPAGLELENQNLEHAFKIDNIKIDKKTTWDWQRKNKNNHTEYRDDRFISAVSLSRYYATELFYLARAVTPGEYTIPPTLVEDMYRPEIRAIGKSIGKMVITE